MGGYGSGGATNRDHLEDHISVDVRYWKRNGMLRPGSYYIVWWELRGEVTDKIGVRVYEDSIVLLYSVKAYDSDWQDIEQRVYLTYTSCNFGGERIWFRCPDCSRRVAKLYSRIPRFACRRCCDMLYQSQCETDIDRTMRRARRVRQKLGTSMSLLKPISILKPKGMHKKTFTRLRAKALKIENQLWHGVLSKGTKPTL